MVLSLGYRRPQHVGRDDLHRTETEDTYTEKEDGSVRSGRSNASAGVPTALTFDKIINGGTCPVS
jgi:hypothetical protein